MDLERFSDYSFDIGPMGPPSEHGSLQLRVARNCPWNRCLFCTSYKGRKPDHRGVDEIKKDIDTAKMLRDEIEMACLELGYTNEAYAGWGVGEAVRGIVRGNPEIYEEGSAEQEAIESRLQSLLDVAQWFANGCKTVFFQDADPLAMEQRELVEVLRYFKQAFPATERITAYARSTTCCRKSVEELRELHREGLTRLHIGMESGCDEVLDFIKKGVTAKEHIESGRKVKESGISLSEYVMPGLGGRKWSEKHALETARVVSEIDPDFVRIRSLAVVAGSGLYRKRITGEFEPLTEDEMVAELGLFIGNLDCNSRLVSDQLTNLLPEVEGQLPQAKGKMLRVIEGYRTMSALDRSKFKLSRYLTEGYFDCVRSWGKLDPQLEQLIQEAKDRLEEGSPESQARVEQVIACLKEKGIP